jgi:apolipoprotein N-acyltransferase
MVSTVGVSAFVASSGDIRASTDFDVPAVVVREMRLGSTRTLATRLGLWPEMTAVALTFGALAVIALAGALPLRRRRLGDTAPETTTEER